MRSQRIENPGHLRVAYLTTHYPFPSHVFIEREIEGLRRLGVEVHTFAVRPTPPAQLLSGSMRAESDRTTVLLESRWQIVKAAAHVTRHAPDAVISALGTALRTGERTLRARTWQLFYLAEALRLYAEMEQRGLRHLHVHLANNSADVARLVVAVAREIHGPDDGWMWTLTMHGSTEFEAVDRFDLPAKVVSAEAVACVSDFTRSQLMRFTEPDIWPRLHVVRMSVDIVQYAPPPRLRMHGGPLRILSVGRLIPEKGLTVLLDALAELRARGVGAEVRIVGAGPLEPFHRRRLIELELTDRVHLLGALGQDELPAHYAWADVFCLPSFQEGLPVVLMEAMATGLPVVASGISGIPELVVDGHNGRLVTPGRADLVANSLAELASDPVKRQLWGRRGRQRVVDQFSTAVTAASKLEFLSRAEAEHRTGMGPPRTPRRWSSRLAFVALTVLAVMALAGHGRLSGPSLVRLGGNHGLHFGDLVVLSVWLLGGIACASMGRSAASPRPADPACIRQADRGPGDTA